MTKLFREEQKVLDELLKEWYDAIGQFTKASDGIFSEKGKMYDRESPVWERVRFPHGYVQELRKKTDRIGQLLVDYDVEDLSTVNWSLEDGVLEELADILNFSRMMAALVGMLLRRISHD